VIRRAGRNAKEEAMSKQLATGAGVTVGATLLMGGAAQAATLTVGSLADTSGATDCATATNTDCTLRDAITDANGDSGSTIGFRSGLSGTITLGGGLPAITVPMTISGPGAGQIAVSGDNAYRPFELHTALGDDVSISGLTITNGAVSGSVGGGILSKYADLTLSDAVVSGNDADNGGGGIAAYDGGSLTIERSTVSGNTSARGSGVYTMSSSGTAATIRSSTVSGNTGSDFGGGVYFDYSSPGTLENSTVYGNSASNSGGGVYDFGAYNGAPGLVVTGSTITHNTADRGGGLACYGSSDSGNDLTEPIVRNTIIFGNTADSADMGPDLSCNFVSGTEPPGVVPTAFSLIGSVATATQLNQSGPNLLGQDPQLGPLADNGGSTQTQKPAVASPVIDQGAAFGLTADQRGQGRPLEIPSIPNAAGGDGSDIGAVELQASELPSNSFTAKVKGKKLLVTVSAAGSVGIADAKAPLSASEAKKKKKKKRKLFLKASNGAGAPPTITVALRLTKFAKQKLRQKGKVTAKTRITFTPNRGLASTQTAKLKIKGKRKK
jgi:hypothetical protein